MLSFLEYIQESVGKVVTKKYSWGTMKTVHHGSDFSIPLHPEHHQAIAKLKDEQEHKFKDETGHHWVARRKGDTVHFDTTGNGSLKTHVPLHTMNEDVDNEYANWKDSIRKKNPKHAEKIKFKSKADQRDTISAEHGDRSFGTFNMKTGKGEHLGEAKVEEIDLCESSDAHKVLVTVSDPTHPAVTKRKEQIMKHVIVRAGDKGEAQAKAESFYKKKGYKVHGSEYHSKQPATSVKTEQTQGE